jgi:hypothetical protein
MESDQTSLRTNCISGFAQWREYESSVKHARDRRDALLVTKITALLRSISDRAETHLCREWGPGSLARQPPADSSSRSRM